MSKENDGKGWERTNVTNLLRNGQNGTYYARVKVNGKQKWKSLKTTQVAIANSPVRLPIYHVIDRQLLSERLLAVSER